MTTNDRLSYRPAEAARISGISRETIYGLIRKGEIKTFRIGAAIFIRREELERFIRTR